MTPKPRKPGQTGGANHGQNVMAYRRSVGKQGRKASSFPCLVIAIALTGSVLLTVSGVGFALGWLTS